MKILYWFNITKKIKNSINKDEIKSCFLRKRSGDWLQVLSCLDKERKYLIQGKVKNLTDCIIYFCSSDRIALSFALCCGLNCLIKQEGVYFVYKTKEIEFPSTMNPFDKQRMEASVMFYYARNEKLEETLDILKEGLREFEALKTEWEVILNTVDTTNSLDRLKELLLLAFHYRNLDDRFKSFDHHHIIEQFIENPYSEIFTDSSNQWIIANATQTYPAMVRRFRYLNPYVTSVEEKYYNVFRFENSSFESPDMIYGCTLFNMLYTNTCKFLQDFTIKTMKRVMELTSNDPRIASLYTTFFTAKNIIIQSGGASEHESSFSRELMIQLGNYITKYILSDDVYISYFKIADDVPEIFCMSDTGELIIDYLIYQKNIIPRDYLAYVTEMNQEYEDEGEQGPYYEIKEFLKKRRMQPKRMTKHNATVRKHKLFLLQQSRNIKTRRRRNTRNKK